MPAQRKVKPMDNQSHGPFRKTHIYTLNLPKKFLRETLAQMTEEYLALGGKITVGRTVWARGAR